MDLRGISYAVDHDGDPGRDLQVIRDELHCSAVLVYGSDVARLDGAARLALAAGLDVWYQPRLPDKPRRELLDHLARAAIAAEAIRAEHPGRVVFVAGCEHSLFTPGLIPGPHTFVRLKLLRFMPRLRPRVTRKLDTLLAHAARIARAHFDGPVTYAAAFWEDVDWSRFDYVAINLYRMAGNAAAYEQQVRARMSDKPLVITEFGCAAHEGADQTGPAGFLIVKWLAAQPRIKPGHVRDEGVQATYLRELIEVYERTGVHGAFAFTFAMPDFPHRPDDPVHDLDMAGFGVVRVRPDDASAWEPKAAFAELARLYASTPPAHAAPPPPSA